MNKIKLIREDIMDHGEVHATVAEHDDEVEMRRGATTFYMDTGIVAIEGPDTTHYIDVEHVVSWYRPTEVFH